jgi:hypothetical protein
LKIAQRRAGIERSRVATLQRMAKQDGEILKKFGEILEKFQEVSDKLDDIRNMITVCSENEKRLTDMLFIELSTKKQLLSDEAKELLELYRKDGMVSVHTGTEISSRGDMKTGSVHTGTEISSGGDMKTGDVTGRDVKNIGRSAW